jgi:hypothetical protein
MPTSGGSVTPLTLPPTINQRGERGGSMLTNAMLFEKELRRLISEEIDRLKENLTTTPINMHGPGGVEYLQGGIASLRVLDDLISMAKLKSDQSSR